MALSDFDIQVLKEIAQFKNNNGWMATVLITLAFGEEEEYEQQVKESTLKLLSSRYIKGPGDPEPDGTYDAYSVTPQGKQFLEERNNNKSDHLNASRVNPSKRSEIKLFNKYRLHSRIRKVSEKIYRDGHYKEAIQNSFVEVIDRIKKDLKNPLDSRGRDLDGDDLMNRVFGCDGDNQPMIKFNQLETGLDKAEQRGVMYLFKGIVGVRDRKAHLNYIQNDPSKTIEYLALASLLMRLLDENINPE